MRSETIRLFLKKKQLVSLSIGIVAFIMDTVSGGQNRSLPSAHTLQEADNFFTSSTVKEMLLDLTKGIIGVTLWWQIELCNLSWGPKLRAEQKALDNVSAVTLNLSGPYLILNQLQENSTLHLWNSSFFIFSACFQSNIKVYYLWSVSSVKQRPVE